MKRGQAWIFGALPANDEPHMTRPFGPVAPD